jgi:hypothetical protein
LEFIRGKHSPDDDQLSLEADLIPGEYFLFTEVDLPRNPLFSNFTLSAYAEDEISLDSTSYTGCLENALSSCAMQKTQTTYYYDHNEPEVFRCFSMTDSLCEYGYIFWYNGSEEGVLEEKVSMNNLQNVESLPPYNQL